MSGDIHEDEVDARNESQFGFLLQSILMNTMENSTFKGSPGWNLWQAQLLHVLVTVRATQTTSGCHTS